jgi:DNA-binding CsgD family transcriptional regulator
VPYVSERDHATILAIVAEAARGTPDVPLPDPVLECIRELTAADSVAFFDGAPWDRTTRRVWAVGAPEPTPAEREIADAYRFQLPLNPLPGTVGRAVRVSDRLTRRQYRRLDLYQLLGRARRIEFAMDYWATAGGRARGFRFDAARRDFSDRARDAVELMAPHLLHVIARYDRVRPEQEARSVLTARQAEILALVADGLTNDEIGEALRLSRHTVRRHLEHVFLALNVRSRAQAVARVVRGFD